MMTTNQPARSPPVECLGDLLGIKTKMYRLPSKTCNMMNSTMVFGKKEKKQNMCLEDLSAIKTGELMDQIS